MTTSTVSSRGNGARMWSLPRRPASVPEARHLVEDFLLTWKCPDDAVDAALLIATELLTNAVQHAEGTGITFDVSLANGGLMLRVIDGGNRSHGNVTNASTSDPAALEEGGRGLSIVTALAANWGSINTTRGHEVWARLAS
ncbi:ATP-binding protein [Streptomyces asoensis]|uniref:ATP-binding protein n=1 Tax=Streptomyces asoensis TaxID=249586 RepID=UPI0033E56888